jgi:hypothetical protein
MAEKTYQACQGAPVQPGGTCDYCGNAIRYCFGVRSADSKTFVVGCDCVEKIGDSGLVRQIAPAVRKLRRDKAAARAAAVAVELNQAIQSRAERMASLPHPLGYSDRVTGARLSMLDWARWMNNNCGATGKAAILRRIRKELP